MCRGSIPKECGETQWFSFMSATLLLFEIYQPQWDFRSFSKHVPISRFVCCGDQLHIPGESRFPLLYQTKNDAKIAKRKMRQRFLGLMQNVLNPLCWLILKHYQVSEVNLTRVATKMPALPRSKRSKEGSSKRGQQGKVLHSAELIMVWTLSCENITAVRAMLAMWRQMDLDRVWGKWVAWVSVALFHPKNIGSASNVNLGFGQNFNGGQLPQVALNTPLPRRATPVSKAWTPPRLQPPPQISPKKRGWLRPEAQAAP